MTRIPLPSSPMAKISQEFKDLPTDLSERIKSFIKEYPNAGPLFDELYLHFNGSKKRKHVAEVTGTVLAKIDNISITHPIRKKVSLVLYDNCLAVEADQTLATLAYPVIGPILAFPTPNKAKAHWTLVFIPKNESNTLSDQTLVFGWEEGQPFIENKSKFKIDPKGNIKNIIDIISKIIAAQGFQVQLSAHEKPCFVNCHYKAKDG